MRLDDRHDDLIDTLRGFHRTWVVYLGVELGFFSRLREAGANGLSVGELATRTGCAEGPVAAWVSGADAHDLAELRDGRLILDEDTALILLDEARSEFLGGQFVHSAIASLDWGGMLDFFRTGLPLRERPDRYRRSIERLTVQDVAVFFQEALAALPRLISDLARGGRVVDIHCGGGRWLIAMTRRFPRLELMGIEMEADSVERARRNVAEAGLADRIDIRHGNVTQVPADWHADLAYFQYALHQLSDPAEVLRGAWGTVKPGGRLLVLDWMLPSELDGFRTGREELIASVQLDELYQGTALATRGQFRAWFEAGGLPAPEVIELPSGATAFLAERA